MIKLAILGALTLLASSPNPQAKKADTYAVIINAANPYTATSTSVQSTIKKLFLKHMTKWSDGTLAKPYGRKQGSAEEGAFLKAVLNMGDAEVARHWLKMKNMNGTTPPKGVSSDRMLLRYVQKHKGGFGVIKMSAAKGTSGIKILYSF